MNGDLSSNWVGAIGQFAGIVVTVILFLRYLSERDKEIRSIVTDTVTKLKGIMDQVKSMKDDFQHQLDKISTEYVASTKEMNNEMRRIVDSHFAISRDTVQSLSHMDQTVMQLHNTVTDIQKEIQRGKAPGTL